MSFIMQQTILMTWFAASPDKHFFKTSKKIHVIRPQIIETMPISNEFHKFINFVIKPKFSKVYGLIKSTVSCEADPSFYF